MSRVVMCLRLRKHLCLFLSLSLCSFFLLFFTVVQSAGHREILYKGLLSLSFLLDHTRSYDMARYCMETKTESANTSCTQLLRTRGSRGER